MLQRFAVEYQRRIQRALQARNHIGRCNHAHAPACLLGERGTVRAQYHVRQSQQRQVRCGRLLRKGVDAGATRRQMPCQRVDQCCLVDEPPWPH